AHSAYSGPPMGRIGVHHPREIVRVERDYTGGEIVQFSSAFPMELEGRITPRQFMESINAINEILISAYSLWRSVFDNCVEIFSLQLSRVLISTHYEREMKRLERLVVDLNRHLFNLAGLNMLWPRKVGFLFLEIEYYVSWHLSLPWASLTGITVIGCFSRIPISCPLVIISIIISSYVLCWTRRETATDGDQKNVGLRMMPRPPVTVSTSRQHGPNGEVRQDRTERSERDP
ncbi:Golgin subfamily A member 7/ERF4 family-domain-containing protein, partial [Russula vinacea]